MAAIPHHNLVEDYLIPAGMKEKRDGRGLEKEKCHFQQGHIHPQEILLPARTVGD